jgi:hypothetical protein
LLPIARTLCLTFTNRIDDVDEYFMTQLVLAVNGTSLVPDCCVPTVHVSGHRLIARQLYVPYIHLSSLLILRSVVMHSQLISGTLYCALTISCDFMHSSPFGSSFRLTPLPVLPVTLCTVD